MPLTIGNITYANCTPIFTSLAETVSSGDYRFISGVPARLNRMLAVGDIDVCPSSSIEYGKFPGSYLILPDLSISAIGEVRSVLLFSRLPLNQLNGATIGLTAESDTSVILLMIILKQFLGYANHFERTSEPVGDAFRRYPSLLLIGDRAMKAEKDGASSFIYDLGELWYRSTGLPFVFALWLVRRETVMNRYAEVAQLLKDLRNAKQRACESYRQIARECPECEWYGEDKLVDYWNTISYDLTPRHCEGLSLFFHYAVDLGLLPDLPELQFFREKG